MMLAQSWTDSRLADTAPDLVGFALILFVGITGLSIVARFAFKAWEKISDRQNATADRLTSAVETLVTTVGSVKETIVESIHGVTNACLDEHRLTTERDRVAHLTVQQVLQTAQRIESKVNELGKESGSRVDSHTYEY